MGNISLKLTSMECRLLLTIRDWLAFPAGIKGLVAKYVSQGPLFGFLWEILLVRLLEGCSVITPLSVLIFEFDELATSADTWLVWSDSSEHLVIWLTRNEICDNWSKSVGSICWRAKDNIIQKLIKRVLLTWDFIFETQFLQKPHDIFIPTIQHKNGIPIIGLIESLKIFPQFGVFSEFFSKDWSIIFDCDPGTRAVTNPTSQRSTYMNLI